MAEFFDYDPYTGLTRYFDYNEMTGEATIHTREDVSSLLKLCAEERNTGITDKELKKDDYLCKYARLPMTVVMSLRSKGIDVFNPDHGKAMMRELDANYSHFKTTYKHHDR